MTLPVTFEETVAARLAVTYPDAFSTVRSTLFEEEPVSRASTVRTAIAFGRFNHQTANPAMIKAAIEMTIGQIRTGLSGFALRSMRRSSSVGLGGLMNLSASN